VPEGVEVVITQPEDMLPDTYPAWQRRPSHWPGGVRWVHLRSTGVDRYPSWVFDAPMVTTSSGSQATSISEYVLSAILAQEKRGQQLTVANPKMWIETRERVRNRPVGGLEGKVLGLVGFGHIGKAVASRAKPFGMKVIASNRSGSPSADAPKVEMLALDDVVRRADHLVIAVPLTRPREH
jgi:phosphoglycerate dehydrogenase-like enzyme